MSNEIHNSALNLAYNYYNQANNGYVPILPNNMEGRIASVFIKIMGNITTTTNINETGSNDSMTLRSSAERTSTRKDDFEYS